MDAKKNPIVIIGNCAAAAYAAEAFREHDKNTPITIVSGEPHYAYFRMRLSHLLGENPDVNKLLIHDPGWYDENNVKVLLGRRAASINTHEHAVKLDNGEIVNYSRLLLSQGSNPFVPPVDGADLRGVFSIRTIDDVKNLYVYSRDKEKGVVVGGGVLGLEAAWALAKKGKKITVIETAPYLLINQLDETASGMLKSLGEKAGMSFMLSAQLSGIKGNGGVTSVNLKDGNAIPADFVIFSTGVRSNTAVLKDTGIKVNRGAVVDEFMRTSIEDVYAAGDVAEYNGKVYGIWPVAKEQGRTAGLNMAGIKTPYAEVVPSNYIKVFDVEMFSAGDLCKDGSAQHIIADIRPEQNIYRRICFKDNAAVGTILFGDTKPTLKISNAIKAKTNIPDEIMNSGDFKTFMDWIKSIAQ